MKDLISIIINVYNGEDYITRCLDSVINQTYKNIEILIVNDCSSDNTLKLINKYKDKRIKVITNKKNLGLSLSRNIGIDNAKGKYLYFVDADDYIASDTIEYLYKLCIDNNVLMSTCECAEGNSSSFIFNITKEEINILSGVDLLKKVLLLNKRSGTTWNKLMHKDLFKNIRFEDRIVNDVVVTYKQALIIDKYVHSNQIKYYYYRHNDSIMGLHKEDRSIDLYEASLERYNKIKELYPNMIENDIGICIMIITIYENKTNKIEEYFKKNRVKSLLNKRFKIKYLFNDYKFSYKIKFLIYRISPKLFSLMIKLYRKLKGIK